MLDGTAGKTPEPVVPGLDLAAFVGEVRGHVEACRYNQALQAIVQDFLTPTNQYLEANAPWKLVKTDKEAAKKVLFNAVQSLRVASILLKPFIPRVGGDDLHELQLPDAVGGGEVRRRRRAEGPAGRPARDGRAGRRQGEAAVPAIG